MSPQHALEDPIFRAYLFIIGFSLAGGGIVLGFLHWAFKKQLGSIWSTYRSWLVLAPIAMQAAVKLSGGFIQLPSTLPPESWALGVALMLAFGVLAGLLPALRGMRLNIVDALAGR